MSVSQNAEGFLFSSRASGAVLVAPVDRRIDLFPGESSGNALNAFLIRRVLPRVAVLAGAFAYHGAAVGNGTRSLLLIGASGTGKTTLATAIARTPGWSLLSEDCTVLTGDPTPYVLPGATGSGHWADAVHGLGLPHEDCREMAHYERKFWYEPPEPVSGAAQKLSAVLVLCRREDNPLTSLKTERLEESAAFDQIASQFVRLYPGDRREAGRMRHASSLAAHVPVYRADYPSGFDGLREVADQLCRLPG